MCSVRSRQGHQLTCSGLISLLFTDCGLLFHSNSTRSRHCCRRRVWIALPVLSVINVDSKFARIASRFVCGCQLVMTACFAGFQAVLLRKSDLRPMRSRQVQPFRSVSESCFTALLGFL